MKFARGWAFGNFLGGYLSAGWFLWDGRWGYFGLFFAIGLAGQLAWLSMDKGVSTNGTPDD